MIYEVVIINDEIIFDVNFGELRSLSTEADVITLNAPTARCLQLLLEKEGAVVSRDDFMEKVWQARGIVVSQNTFYQNISLLRKSLKKAGLTKDIVMTVRRKGFMLAEDTCIQPYISEEIISEDVIDKVNHTEQNQELQFVITPSSPRHEARSRSSQTLPKWIIILVITLAVLEIISFIIHYVK